MAVKHFEFNKYCLSCKHYANIKCPFKIRDGLLKWEKLGCNIFEED